jgi:anaerobic ribonucleoside-triphosphate reductase activating protein
LCRKIKRYFPNVKIWAYSGFYWDKIKDLSLMEYLDVVVDGPFSAELYDEKLHWRGSSNQSVIDVQRSLKTKEKICVEGC